MKLVRVKSKDAPLRALDFAVLKFQGKTHEISQCMRVPAPNADGTAAYIQLRKGGAFCPTENWAQVGHLLEARWVALTRWLRANVGEDWETQAGSSVLPMLVRALVACQIDEFDVPEHLLAGALENKRNEETMKVFNPGIYGGTVSVLRGVTEGIHPSHSQPYVRKVAAVAAQSNVDAPAPSSDHALVDATR